MQLHPRRTSQKHARYNPVSYNIILPASLRYRLLSETRIAVCLILGSVFVLWQEGGTRTPPPSILMATGLLLLPFSAGEVYVWVTAGFPRSELFPLKGAFSPDSFEPSRPPGDFIRTLVHALFSSVHGGCSAD